MSDDGTPNQKPITSSKKNCSHDLGDLNSNLIFDDLLHINYFHWFHFMQISFIR